MIVLEAGRLLLIKVFLVFVVFFLLMGTVYWYCSRSVRAGKDAYREIRERFEKEHPILARRLHYGMIVVLLVMSLAYGSILVLDIIYYNVLVTGGTVVEWEPRMIWSASVRLEDKRKFVQWFGNPEIQVGKEYTIYYVPRTKVIVHVVTSD